MPGASRTVLEAQIPYHSDSLTKFLGFSPDQSCSAETSQAMAQRAWQRGRSLAPGASVVGVGLTASLATDRPKKGEHRFHLTLQTRMHAVSVSLILSKGQRDRAGEELVLDLILLNAMAEEFGIPDRIPLPLMNGETIERSERLANDALARLCRGETSFVCREPDGRIRTERPGPQALLSGSFNPLHAGHQRLADVAQRITGKTVAFELPVRNADKPAIAIEEIERRLRQFTWTRSIWLTQAPTFVEKAKLFPGATWVVGADTAARIMEPRFYGGEAERNEALSCFRSSGSRLLVAGRRDVSGRFVGLDDLEIPGEWRDLFSAIPETEFRFDGSSTEIRAGDSAIRAMEA
jgi:hypothetical protein